MRLPVTFQQEIWVNQKTEMTMRLKLMLIIFSSIGMAALSGAAAQGQAGTPAQVHTGAAQPADTRNVDPVLTDAGLSFYKTFTSATSGHGTTQTPSNSVGGLFEVRQIFKPLFGYDVSYSFNPASQSYAPEVGACAYACQNPPTKVTASASEIAFNWVASYKVGSLRPFVLAGLGLFIAVPRGTAYGNITIVRPTYVYGGGLDWNVGPRFGLRIQYRGNVYKAPDISQIYPTTGAFTQTAEPMAGVFYRF